MIEETEFGAGLGVIALQLNKPITTQVIRAYHLAFERETDPDEWAAFARAAATRAGWNWLPTVPELLDTLREFRGAPPLMTEAVAAYERVLGAGQYTAQAGTQWTFRGVLEACGRAAAEAFQASGASSAFSSTWDEARRRERFCAAYTAAARAMPAERLLPAGSAPLALPPSAPAPELGRSAAAAVVERIRVLAGVPAPKPVAPVVVATDDRMEELRRQAAAITGEPAQAGE